MQTAFQGNGSHRRAITLHGLGGIGKTQLAVSFIKKRRDFHSAIFWLNSRSQDTLKRSFLGVAERIKLHHPSARLKAALEAANVDQVVEAVKHWLSAKNNIRWMLVFDNFDTPGAPDGVDSRVHDVRPYFPDSDQGFILITTRSKLVQIGKPISVPKLQDARESVAILEIASQRRISATGIHRSPPIVQSVGLTRKQILV